MARKSIKPEKDGVTLRFLYGTLIGRSILKILAEPKLSAVAGKFMDSKYSKFIIPYFISNNNINMQEYMKEDYSCFNDCFTRRVIPECRKISMDDNDFISPCDGLLSAYKNNKETVVPVKRSSYTIGELLVNDEVAREYNDGICLVFRLCVNNYHRYCYLDNGTKDDNHFIPGVLHTVRPIALKKRKVFVENSREYTLLRTENFGTVAQIEVGAMLVGKIDNYHKKCTFKRGEEKGKFLYGGSTIILLVKKNRVRFPKYLFEETEKGMEVPVKMGEKIGIKKIVVS